eukprot:gene16423-16601_t
MLDRMDRNLSTFPARRSLLLGGGALALGASGLIGCDTDFKPIRFRETLSFNVDGQIRTGSSVMEYHSWQQHGNIDGNLSGSRNKGQAIIVDLGQGRFVFGGVNGLNLSTIIVSGANPTNLGPNERLKLKLQNGLVTEEWPTLEPHAALFRKFPSQVQSSNDSFVGSAPSERQRMAEAAYQRNLQSIRSQRGVRLLAVDELPLLVTFKNIKDPTTAELVDPRHMDQVFGPGVSFRSAAVGPVDDTVPITTGITDLIPWIAKNNGEPIGPKMICSAGELCVDGSFFRSSVK